MTHPGSLFFETHATEDPRTLIDLRSKGSKVRGSEVNGESFVWKRKD